MFCSFFGVNDNEFKCYCVTCFKKWGLKMITGEMLATQFANIDRIVEIYNEEQSKI